MSLMTSEASAPPAEDSIEALPHLKNRLPQPRFRSDGAASQPAGKLMPLDLSTDSVYSIP